MTQAASTKTKMAEIDKKLLVIRKVAIYRETSALNRPACVTKEANTWALFTTSEKLYTYVFYKKLKRKSIKRVQVKFHDSSSFQ